MSKYVDKIKEAYANGLLNDYMVQRLLAAVEKGMTDDISEEIMQDGQYASDAGVKDDKGYSVYFFTGRFADDILNDTFGMKVGPDRKKDLLHYVMSHIGDGEYNFDNLTDFRLLVHKWLCDGLSKKAYPNITGKENREKIYDVDKWIATLKDIYSSMHDKSIGRRDAIDYFAADWDADEKQKFENWMRYYESDTTEKYNVKTAKFIKEALGTEISLPQAWVNREDRADDKIQMSTRKEKREQTRREQELTKAKQYKNKMRSRLRSFKRLIERYNDILPKQDLDKVYDELYSLEKSISRLDVYASIQDCIIRSANKLNKAGFVEGAEFLRTAAEGVGPDVMQALPKPESKEPNLPAQSVPMFNIQTAISRLEALSKSLKSRDMIRELASIDILLNEMGMASYFPELTDAQAKMIESFGYSSNKIESIIAKLRGSGTSTPDKPSNNPAPMPVPTPKEPIVPVSAPAKKPIETGGLFEKPVGEIKKTLPTG